MGSRPYRVVMIHGRWRLPVWQHFKLPIIPFTTYTMDASYFTYHLFTLSTPIFLQIWWLYNITAKVGYTYFEASWRPPLNQQISSVFLYHNVWFRFISECFRKAVQLLTSLPTKHWQSRRFNHALRTATPIVTSSVFPNMSSPISELSESSYRA